MIEKAILVPTQKHRKALAVKKRKPRFVDLFAGCGGLSLGLMMAGWTGAFAIESNADAFKTLRHNLVDQRSGRVPGYQFRWPEWLDKREMSVGELLLAHHEDLRQLQGSVQLVAGGPPCQGYSMAGRRIKSDPRNILFEQHFKVVALIKPELVIMENVQGIAYPYKSDRQVKKELDGKNESWAEVIATRLSDLGYVVQQHVINSADFGVPQSRSRFLTLGISDQASPSHQDFDLLQVLDRMRSQLMREIGLPDTRQVTVSEAISDLKMAGKSLVECTDPDSPHGFKEILYLGPKTTYQRLMHAQMNGKAPNSIRLVNHKPATTKRFTEILRTCRKGVGLSRQDRKRLGLRKSAIVPLHPDRPSPTITTLPDDFIHYEEPRVHTVREHARLQSFPDWFEFKGKFTTGGRKRTAECPRYTQVGNAVPPLLARAIGRALICLLD